jgi:hypothetical protein
MSVILEALKKLDREKASRRKEPPSIAVEILKPDLPASRKRFSLSLVIGLLMIIATAALTYTVIAKFGLLSKPSPPVQENLSPTPQQAPSTSEDSGILPKPPPEPLALHPPSLSSAVPKPSPPEPADPSAPRQQVGPPPASREPIRDAQDKISQVPPAVEDHKKIDEPVSAPLEEKTGRKGMPGKADGPPPEAKKTAEPAASGSAATPPSLKLSAIVWYEEPGRRFAVINGMISYEGSVIEGAKVVEIYPDRVRFLQNDRHFEVPIFK